MNSEDKKPRGGDNNEMAKWDGLVMRLIEDTMTLVAEVEREIGASSSIDGIRQNMISLDRERRHARHYMARAERLMAKAQG